MYQKQEQILNLIIRKISKYKNQANPTKLREVEIWEAPASILVYPPEQEGREGFQD